MHRLTLLILAGFVPLAPAADARAVTIDWVTVGNPGNAADTVVQVDGLRSGLGSVVTTYRIAKYEATNNQYTEFLNAVDPTGTNPNDIYSFYMDEPTNGAGTLFNGGITFVAGNATGSKYVVKSGRGNNPVVQINFYRSVRFANWLNNGQGGPGTTEYGAYTISSGMDEGDPDIVGPRNPGAQVWLPSEDEWYKAAYYDPAAGHYWLYPTGTNATPYSDQPPGSDAPTQSNTANFRKNDDLANGYDDGYAWTGSPNIDGFLENYLTDVGAYTSSSSPYGTFDQGGNVDEWNETLFGEFRGLRGGSWDFFEISMDASSGYSQNPGIDSHNYGFRVASLVVPEPSTWALALCGALGLLIVSRHWRSGRIRSSIDFRQQQAYRSHGAA